MTSVATWSVKLEPGKPYKFTALEDDDMDVVLRISNASLGFTIADENARTVVKVTKQKSYLEADPDNLPDEPEDEEIALCVLIPGKIEQALLSVDFGDELKQLEVIGPNEVHLLGNFVNQDSGPEIDSDLDDDSEDDEEGGMNGYRLDEVSSDVEVQEARFDFEDDSDGSDDDADRFEEVADGAKSLKRSADAMDEDAPADGLSKKQKKKLGKKLKNEAGAAVSVTETTTTTTATVVSSPESKKDKAPDSKKDEKKKDKKEKSKGGEGEKKTLAGGLIVQDATVGTGKAAKAGNTLGMRYIGKLEDGKVFDSNTKGKPFSFKLGAGEVIKGWDQGIVGMQVGGERILTIPGPLAYGKKGSKPDIPPNATLKFEIKLLDLK